MSSLGWLGSWSKRIKVTIDHNDITAALSDFPILIYLSASSGRFNDDVSCVFDELQSDSNRKKIAVTKSDGTTECYVEIEKWDDGNEKAWLWVKVPDISSTVDTDLYLYYDSTHADNTTYVGDPADAVVHNVWDANYKYVSHMQDDPDTSHVGDSTVNANVSTKTGAGSPVEAAGKIGDCQDFSGANNLTVTNHASLSGYPAMTFAAWLWVKSGVQYPGVMSKGDMDPAQWGATYFMGYNHAAPFLGWGVADDSTNASISRRDNDYNALLDGFHYVVGIWDGGTDAANIKIYVDGVLADDQDWSDYPAFANMDVTPSPLYIGMARWGAANSYFRRYMDEVRISNVDRSVAWIKASYETQRDHLLDFGSEQEMFIRSASASLSTVAISGRTASFPRSSSGAIGVVGVSDRMFEGARTAISSFAVIATATRGQILERLVVASFSLNGVSSRTLSAFRSAVATFSLTGVASHVRSLIRSASAALGLEGANDRILHALRSASAVFNGTGVASREWIGTRTASGTVVAQGTPSRILSAFRLATASFSLSGTAVRIKDMFRSASAAFGITGIANRTLQALRIATVSLGMVGVSVRSWIGSRDASGTLSVVGTAVRGWIGTRISSASVMVIGVSDRLLHSLRSVPASISQSADSIRAVIFIRTASGTVTIQAVSNRIMNSIRSAVANLTTSATSVRSWIGVRSSSASINQVAVAIRSIIFTRVASGIVVIQGLTDRVVDNIRSATASISSSAMSERLLSAIRSAPASVNLIAGANRAYQAVRSAVASIKVEASGWFLFIIRIKGIVTLQLARKTRFLNFVDKERTLFLSSKLWVLDIVDKIRKLKLGRKET